MGDRTPQIVSLRLATASEMFVLDQTDLFSEYRNFLTGVEYCISVLRGRRSRAPVRLELTLPPAEAHPDTAERIRRSLLRYCDHRMAYNRRERSATRLDGAHSLWIGLPIAVVGFLLATWSTRHFAPAGSGNILLDTGGWILVWVGVWFPLDTALFTPLAYGRENRVLARLRDAVVVVDAGTGTPRPGGGTRPQSSST